MLRALVLFGSSMLLLGLSSPTPPGNGCTGESPETCRTGAMGSFGGKWYTSSVSEADLESAPEWNPEEDPSAPLDPGRAARLAWKELLETIPGSEDWDLTEIRLSSSWKSTYWYYTVGFVPPSEHLETGGSVSELGIVVLMDGRVMALEEYGTKR